MAGIGLGIAISGLVIGVGSSAASFGQAAAQGAKRRKAEIAAANAFKDARKRLEVNYMEDLGINKGIYDIARDRSMVSAAGQLQAAREGSARGVASTAGQVYQQDLLGQQQVRAAQEGEMNRIEGLIAGEDARLAGLQASLSLQEAEGAQQAARDAESARVSALGEGIQGALGAAGSAADMVSLYGQGSKGARKTALSSLQEGDVNLETGVLTESIGGIGALSKRDAAKKFNNLDAGVQQQITGSTAYQEALFNAKKLNRQGFSGNSSFSNSTLTAEERALIEKNPEFLDILLKVKG